MSQVEQEETTNELQSDIGPISVSKLATCADISDLDIELLKNGGFHTVQSVAYSTEKRLCEIRGISEEKAKKLIDESINNKLFGIGAREMGFKSAQELLLSRKDIIQITTGSKDLDKLLGGGIESGSITEVFGEFGTGKSQLCHTLAVTCQLPLSKGGGDGKCMYIDTEGTFRPHRLIEIAKNYGIDEKQVLANVAVARCYNTDHQLNLMHEAALLMTENKFSIIIIDSVTHLFRTEFFGLAELAERQQMLARFLRMLQQIGNVYGVACVITNQVVEQVDGHQGTTSIKNKTKPVGGHIIAHASTTRLSLKRGKGESKICRIYDSPDLAPGEATFTITVNGISDNEPN